MNCIVNVTTNWGIGCGNRLLVPISADLKRFRQLTAGKVVILGRKTLATFPCGRPLPNRVNLVLSSDRSLAVEGARVAHSLPELLKSCRSYPREALCVIGGASVYESLLAYCDTAQITRTFLTLPADRFFPNLDELPGWSQERSSEIMEENGVRFQYLDYQNRSPLPFPD